MTELRDFLGKQFDAVYEKTKTIDKAITDTVDFLKAMPPEQPSVESPIGCLNCTFHHAHRTKEKCDCFCHQPKPKCVCSQYCVGGFLDLNTRVAVPCPCDCHGEGIERREGESNEQFIGRLMLENIMQYYSPDDLKRIVQTSPQPPKEALKGIADKCGNCVCITWNPGDCECSCHVYTKAEIDEKFRRMLVIVQSYDKTL